MKACSSCKKKQIIVAVVYIRYSYGIQEALGFHQKLFTLPRTVRHASAHAVVAMGWLSVFNCFSIDAQVHSWPFFASALSQLCENSESACYGRIYWTHVLASCPHLGPSWPHLGPSLSPFWPVLNLDLRRQNPSLLPSFPKEQRNSIHSIIFVVNFSFLRTFP